jgi:hypothetical protein
MPIGPTRSIGLGRGGHKWVELNVLHVGRLNAMQVDNASTWVMYHPQSSLRAFVETMRPEAG